MVSAPWMQYADGEEAHSVADTATGASLLGDELVANHLLRKLLGLFRTVHEIEVSADRTGLGHRESVASVRVDHLDTTLETVRAVKVTFTASTCEHLGLDDEPVGACWSRSTDCLHGQQRTRSADTFPRVRESVPKFCATSRASLAEKAGRDLGVGTPYCRHDRISARLQGGVRETRDVTWLRSFIERYS